MATSPVQSRFVVWSLVVAFTINSIFMALDLENEPISTKLPIAPIGGGTGESNGVSLTITRTKVDGRKLNIEIQIGQTLEVWDNPDARKVIFRRPWVSLDVTYYDSTESCIGQRERQMVDIDSDFVRGRQQFTDSFICFAIPKKAQFFTLTMGSWLQSKMTRIGDARDDSRNHSHNVLGAR